jgi:hypothetical protein
MWIILTGLEMEGVLVELTILLSADLMGGTAWIESREMHHNHIVDD